MSTLGPAAGYGAVAVAILTFGSWGVPVRAPVCARTDMVDERGALMFAWGGRGGARSSS
jgi:hypothetical protein